MGELTKSIWQVVIMAIVIIAVVFFATLYFVEKKHNVEMKEINDSLTKSEIQKAFIEKDNERLEKEKLDLLDELDTRKSEEVKIINNNTKYKNRYPTLKPSETDTIFLNIFR